MAILWLKFPDEVVLYSSFSADDKRNLEGIFSASNHLSSWSKALEIIGLEKLSADSKLIYWHQDVPYFNWSCMVQTISGGAISAGRTPDNQYSFKISYRLGKLWSLIVSQWKLARFIQKPNDINDKFAESIALGLVLQSLIMRLGLKAEHLALWLSSPQSAPSKYRKTIMQIQSVQLRRTEISHVWRERFPPNAEEDLSEIILPEFFWDDEIPIIKKADKQNLLPTKQGDKWSGLSACAGEVTGLAVAVSGNTEIDKLIELKQKHQAPIILVFKRSRPETTELFQYADAVLYAEGGALSHACTIAREMNIPCITALGRDFFSLISEGEGIWLKIDAKAGFVEQISFE